MDLRCCLDELHINANVQVSGRINGTVFPSSGFETAPLATWCIEPFCMTVIVVQMQKQHRIDWRHPSTIKRYEARNCFVLTVKAKSCPLMIQMPVMVLLLSTPDTMTLAKAFFLSFSRRWNIPVDSISMVNTGHHSQHKHTEDKSSMDIFPPTFKTKIVMDSRLQIFLPSNLFHLISDMHADFLVTSRDKRQLLHN